MGLIYGNKFELDQDLVVNEQVILEKYNITKEEILKDPKTTLRKLKHLYDEKVNKSGEVQLILFGIFIVSGFIAAATNIIPLVGVSIASLIGEWIVDKFEQKGKIITGYSKYQKEAVAIKNAIHKEINKLDHMIKTSDDKKLIEVSKKEKAELEKILSTLKTYKNDEDYYRAYGYSSEEIKYEKESINSAIYLYNKGIYDFDDCFGDNGIGLYYTGVTQQQFEKFIKDLIKENGEKIYSDVGDYIDPKIAKKEYDYLNNHKSIEVANNGGGDCLLYIPDEKVFLFFDHENGIQINIKQKFSYTELMSNSKERIEKDIALIQADAELGYYRLSEPPKGVERKPF